MADVIYSAPSSPIASDYEAVQRSNAVWEALRQRELETQMLETQAKQAEQDRRMKEAVMDKLLGYGTPEQRAGELGQPLPQGAVAEALQRGSTFSNIAPGGQYYTTGAPGGGTPVQHRLGAMIDMPKPTPGQLSGPERKIMGLPEQSPEEKYMRDVAKMVLQESIRSEGRMAGIQERERLVRGRPEKPEKAAHRKYTEEVVDEYVKTIAAGKVPSAALEAAYKTVDPKKQSAFELTKFMLKTNNAFIQEQNVAVKVAMFRQQMAAIENLAGMSQEEIGEREQDFIEKLPNPKQHRKSKGGSIKSPYTGKSYYTDGKDWYEE